MTSLLAPLDRPAPRTWRPVVVAAVVTVFLCFATARWVPPGVATSVPYLASVLPVRMLAAGVVLLALLLGAAYAGVVALAVDHPWPAIGLTLLPALVALVGDVPLHFGVVAGLGAVSVVAAWRRPTASLAATAAAVLVVVVWLGSSSDMAAPFGASIQQDYWDPGRRTLTGLLYVVALLLALGAGLVLRGQTLREEQRRELVHRVGEVEQQAGVVAERARLARDLHDVVAHHVSLIAVRAETAPYTEPDLDPRARTLLAEIAADARLALDELRGVLGILGRAQHDAARSPQPTWGDIAALVGRSRATGVDVSLHGDVGVNVPAAVGYVAYRVVQEALTNARKHAPGAPVLVSAEALPTFAVVTVRCELSPGATPGTAGHGLVGMRERVDALGGRLVVGRREGEFVVEATLPLGSGAGTGA